MAFNGKLLELKTGNSWVNVPMDFFALESYSATQDQRMESSANRATSGKLVRTTVEHTATKIEFKTPPITNREVAVLNGLLSAAYIDELERKVEARYYDPATDSYKTGEFYVPDVEYPIYRVDLETNTVYYKSLRYALIEY